MEAEADGCAPRAAASDGEETAAAAAGSTEHWLSRARQLVPPAVESARGAKGYTGRWKTIISQIERLPPCLSDLSSHPCFAKNALCREQLQSVCRTLTEVIELAGQHGGGAGPPPPVGKLQMQSDLHSLSGKLDLNLRDCNLLIKTGVLGEFALPLPDARASAEPPEAATPSPSNVRELLARLQIGHEEAKHRAVDGLLELMKENANSVAAALNRSNISSIIQLLTATSHKVREKAAVAVCFLVESGNCGDLLVSEGVLPPLIRLAESGSPAGRENAVISLQRFSMTPETARSIVGHGGVCPLIEICRTGDSVSQAAAAAALKNLSAVPEVRQTLAEEGVIRIMISLLGHGIVLGSKEYAAECLQHLTATNESLRQDVLAAGGLRNLLVYLDCPSPPEPAVGAVRNLVGSVPPQGLVSTGLLPRLVHVLKAGSVGAQQAAAAAICKISGSPEIKKLVGELGCVSLLIPMLEAKTAGAREAAAQAMASLMSYSQNAREVKKDAKSVPNLAQLLDPSPQNTAKKYAVSCLLMLSSSKRCRKRMVSYGAVGYLKKLSEMDVPGSKRLLERLERGKIRSFFGRR